MPQQNEIDLALTAEQLTTFDATLTALEAAIDCLPQLTADMKDGLVRTPENADGWMAGMLTRAGQNLNHLPRDFDPADVQRDLTLNATLGPRELRLARALDRVTTARFLARSDAFAALLSVRRTLKDAGLAGVDDDLSEGLQRFFRREKSTLTTPVPAAG